MMRIDDSKKARTRNEDAMMKRFFSNRSYSFEMMDTVTLEGPGAQKLVEIAGGKDAFFDLVSELRVPAFIKRRYNLESDTLQDLLDAMPLFSALHLDLRKITGGMKHDYHIIFIKESMEGKELASFRIPKIHYEFTELLDKNRD